MTHSDPRIEPVEGALKALSERLEPTPSEVADMQRRVRLAAAQPTRPRWLWAGAGLALAGATALLLTLGTGGPTTVELASLDGWVERTVAGGVDVRLRGDTAITTEGRVVSLDLRAGEVQLEVPHGEGYDVQVRTPEALVRVVGTAFSVHHGPVGTAVEVSRGVVAVTCGSGAEQRVEGGSDTVCLRSAAAGLAHARALESEGAEPAQVLHAVDLAFALQPDAVPLRQELAVVRVEALVRSGSETEALEAAEEALTRDPEGPRTADLHRLAGQLALPAGGCARAVAHLEALVAVPGSDPMPAVLLAGCLPDEPERARELLTGALELATSPEQRADIQVRIDALE